MDRTKIKNFTSKWGPMVLTGFGVAGMFSAGIMAVKATPRAMFIINEEEKAREESKDYRTIRNIDKIKMCWKCYAPSVLISLMSAGCIIYSSVDSTKRNTAMMTMCSISEAALKEYQSKVVEVIGEKKEREVRDKITEDRMTKYPFDENEVILTGNGNSLCFDNWSSRYFRCDRNYLDKIENRLNKRLRNEYYLSLNDFYYEIGLESTKAGEVFGWDTEKIENKLNHGIEEIEYGFSSKIAPNGEPCLVVDFKTIHMINSWE